MTRIFRTMVPIWCHLIHSVQLALNYLPLHIVLNLRVAKLSFNVTGRRLETSWNFRRDSAGR